MAELPKVLRVGLVLDGRIVSERLIRSGADVSVGSEPSCSFVLPDEPDLPLDQTVFRARRSGYELLLDSEMKGKVATKGRVKPLAEVAEGERWRLDESARGRLVLTPRLALLFQFVPAPPEPLRKGGQDFRPRYIEPEDPVFYGFLGLFSAMAAVAMVYVYSQPPGQNIDIEQYEDLVTHLVMQPSDLAPVEDAPDPEPDPIDEATEPEGPTEVADAGGPSQPGPADNPRTHQAMERHVEQNNVLEAFMIATRGINQRGDRTNSLFGDDAQVRDDLDGALAGVQAVRVASNDGPLIRGPQDGYVDAELGELHDISVNRVTVEEPEPYIHLDPPEDLDPTLQPREVTQVAELVRRQSPSLQRCYELALNDDPTLSGRVEIAWSIMDGKAEMVEVFRNTTGNAGLADCMVGRIERWDFPESLETDLVYPFVLTRKN